MRILSTLTLVLLLGSFPGLVTADPAAPANNFEVADGVVSGILEAVDPATERLTMSGETFVVPASVADLSGFGPGDGVVLSYFFDETGSRQVLTLRRMEQI